MQQLYLYFFHFSLSTHLFMYGLSYCIRDYIFIHNAALRSLDSLTTIIIARELATNADIDFYETNTQRFL